MNQRMGWSRHLAPKQLCLRPRAQGIAESVIVWECGDQLQNVGRMVKDERHESVGTEDIDVCWDWYVFPIFHGASVERGTRFT
jgi:hypothetical protein